MPEVRLTPQASSDLELIWLHIATQNGPAADRLIEKFSRRFTLAAQFPEMGVARDEVHPGARVLVEGVYLAFYLPIPDGIEVIAIVHGATDPRTWLP